MVNDPYRVYRTKIPNWNFRNFFVNGKQPEYHVIYISWELCDQKKHTFHFSAGEKEMENFRSWALDLVDLLESPWSSWASTLLTHVKLRDVIWHQAGHSWLEDAGFATVILFWRCQPDYSLFLGAKQGIVSIKDRFRLTANLRSTQSARCSSSVFSKELAARKKNLTNARARKNKHTARMLANARKGH